jgi:oligopeptide transport system substrate-binding protein
MAILTRVVFSFAALVLLLGMNAACGGGDDARSSADPSRDLNLSLRFEPTNLDPQRASVVIDIGIVRELGRGLLWNDEKLRLTPMAAKEVPTQKNGGISNDGLVYTFKLREGLKWSDGEPLSAADFEYGIKRLLDPGIKAVKAAAYYDITGAERYNTCKECSAGELARLREEVGVKAVDGKTLVITLHNLRVNFLYGMSHTSVFPVRKDLVEKFGDAWASPENFVGNGPFVIKELVPNDRLVLSPNPHWWGAQSRVKTVVFKIIPDLTDAFNAYLAGDLDVAEVPPEQTNTVAEDPLRRKENVRVPLLQTGSYNLNNRMAPFDNAKVRMAFTLAVNREAFIEEVVQGVGTKAYSWLPPASASHTKDLGLQWKFDPERARTLLAEAGYPNGNGLPAITYPYPKAGLHKSYAEFFQRQIEQNLNVSITLEPMESRDWTPRVINRKDYQVAFVNWAFSVADAESSMAEFFGCQKTEGDRCTELPANNLVQYANPNVDRFLQQALKEQDPRRRSKLYAKAEQFVVQDTPAIFMYYGARNILVKPYLRNLTTSPLDSLFAGQYFLELAYIARQ